MHAPNVHIPKVAGERGVSNEDIADAVDGETPKEALLTLIEENVPDPTEHPVLSAYCALCDAANIKPTTATLALFMHELIALCKVHTLEKLSPSPPLASPPLRSGLGSSPSDAHLIGLYPSPSPPPLRRSLCLVHAPPCAV